MNVKGTFERTSKETFQKGTLKKFPKENRKELLKEL